tara:strand:- start:1055 stop:1372 length:318 start_codon:yes stop_codon:yes gene_type:complete
MNFDLDKQRHQFGVLLVLFILVYSGTADEPRKSLEEFDEVYSDYYDENCENTTSSDDDDAPQLCETISEFRSENTTSFIFRYGIMVLAAVFAYISFSDDDSEDGG